LDIGGENQRIENKLKDSGFVTGKKIVEGDGKEVLAQNKKKKKKTRTSKADQSNHQRSTVLGDKKRGGQGVERSTGERAKRKAEQVTNWGRKRQGVESKEIGFENDQKNRGGGLKKKGKSVGVVLWNI